jgi:hypothetical protein
MRHFYLSLGMRKETLERTIQQAKTIPRAAMARANPRARRRSVKAA